MNWIQSASGQICWPYGFPKPKANNMFKAEITTAARSTEFDLQVLAMSIQTLLLHCSSDFQETSIFHGEVTKKKT